MLIKEISAKSILSKSKVSDWTINPYIGCQHGCFYCYAQFIKRFKPYKEPWGQFVEVKINAPELLEKEIKKKRRGVIWISGLCDPYQPLENKYQLTRKILEIIQKYNWPVTIQTKSPLILRDLNLLKKFHRIEVGFSITTGNDRIRRLFEPKAPSIEERIKALERLQGEGIKTFVMIAPLLPQAETLVLKLKGKTSYVLIDEMNYHYADWVYQKYGLKKAQNNLKLAQMFQKQGIPCRIIN